MQANQSVRPATYPMDNYDGGRAAAEPEHFRKSELGFARRPRERVVDDDATALALAIINLTYCN
jgi:hypothetical protein